MKIFHQSVFEPWHLEDKSVQTVITSPPYFNLRKYDIPDIILNGDKDCQHEFIEKIELNQSGGKGYKQDSSIGAWYSSVSSSCKCGAWKGQYGLEPDPVMFIEHTRMWVKEVWRVLKDDGVFFLNIADTYNSGRNGGHPGGKKQWTDDRYPNQSGANVEWMPAKCKLMIPHRIAIALVDDGWTLRNDIVWFKPNAMPESTRDRFSKKFEYVFMFTKQEKYYFDLDAIKVKVENKWIPTEQNKGTKNPGDVWSINNKSSSEKHYAMMPDELAKRMILCSTKKGDIVLDPFCGSGTTLKIAEENRRVGFGIDLGYEEVQQRRLSRIKRNLF